MKTHGRKLRGAVVGFGFIAAQGHAPAYQDRDDVDIVAVADVCKARRHHAARSLAGARVYKNVDALLAAETHLDFLDIATPPSLHASIARKALGRGIHVLCEKPLTTGADEASALLEQALLTKRVLYPCHNYRFAPVVRSINQVLASGRIGTVRSVTLNTYRNTHAKGVPEWRTDWRRERRFSGGGIAMDHGSHTFYLTFDWLNAWPTALTAKMITQEPDRWDTEDNFSAVLTFPGDRLAHVHLTWTAGMRQVVYTLHGDLGAIVARDDDLEILTMRAPTGTEPAPNGVAWDVERRSVRSDWMDASHRTWFNAMFDGFVEAIENGDYVGRDTLDAYRCIDVIDTAYLSAAEGSRELSVGERPPLVGLVGGEEYRTAS